MHDSHNSRCSSSSHTQTASQTHHLPYAKSEIPAAATAASTTIRRYMFILREVIGQPRGEGELRRTLAVNENKWAVITSTSAVVVVVLTVRR